MLSKNDKILLRQPSVHREVHLRAGQAVNDIQHLAMVIVCILLTPPKIPAVTAEA